MKSIKRVHLCSACKVKKQEKWKLKEVVLSDAAATTRHGYCSVCKQRRALTQMQRKDGKEIDVTR